MTTARHAGLLLAALAALAAGCGSTLGTPPCQDGSCGTQVSVKTTAQHATNSRLDLLFVVDDTPAIAPYADRLASGFADMAATLQQTALPLSLHVGFVRAGSCDTSTRARTCGVNAPASFVALQPCNTVSNASGTFGDTFACLGALGASDCGPNQPLAAALQALDPSNTSWSGFLRPDAYLDVVIVAATDDASGPANAPTPVKDIVDKLHALKPDPSWEMATVIMPGSPDAWNVPSPPRLFQLVSEFGANGLYLDLSSDPLATAVTRFAETSNVGVPPPCLTNVRDVDAATPGIQASCTVVQRNTWTDTGTTIEQKIPSCKDSPPPCWQDPLPTACSDGSPGWGIFINGPVNQCVDGTISFDVECLGCADPGDPACPPP